MSVALEHDEPPDLVARWRNAVSRVVFRPVYHIPAANYAIISVLTVFLIKLTRRYLRLYTWSSLAATIATNLVLYGIADTMAQLILAYEVGSRRLRQRSSTTDSVLLGLDDAGYFTDDDDDMDRFMAYLDSQEQSAPAPAPTPAPAAPSPPPPPLVVFLFRRLAGFMVWGFILAFVQVWWYLFLQIYSNDPTIVATLRKVLTDQLLFLPISLFCFFQYGTRVLEGGSSDDASAKLRQVYFSTLVINWSLWIPVQSINLSIVPRSMQVPFSSTIGVFWNCFLSWRSSRAAA